MKKNNSIIGSIIGFLSGSVGVIASTCGMACGACVGACGSAAISLFGLSSVTTGAFLNKWQPLFIAISILAFSYAFYNLYFRKPKVENCATDASCECPPQKSSTLRFQKTFLWVALLVSIVFYSYPLFSSTNNSTCNPDSCEQSSASCDTTLVEQDSLTQCKRTCDKPCE